jgi:hypothetical protein
MEGTSQTGFDQILVVEQYKQVSSSFWIQVFDELLKKSVLSLNY